MLREDLDGVDGLAEVTMFGGRCWLLRGNLLCGARTDGLLVRLGRDNESWALAQPSIAPMVMGARRMHGWVRAAPDAFADDTLRRRLLDGALAFAGSLPPKGD